MRSDVRELVMDVLGTTLICAMIGGGALISIIAGSPLPVLETITITVGTILFIFGLLVNYNKFCNLPLEEPAQSITPD